MNTPSPESCAIPWCRPVRPHDGETRVHLRDLATIDSGDVTVAVGLYQHETRGVLADPVVRIFVDSTDERHLDEKTELTPQAATILSNALAGVTLAKVGELIAAFAHAQILLGERAEPVDYYEQTFIVSRSALQIEADTALRSDEHRDGGDR